MNIREYLLHNCEEGKEIARKIRPFFREWARENYSDVRLLKRAFFYTREEAVSIAKSDVPRYLRDYIPWEDDTTIDGNRWFNGKFELNGVTYWFRADV